MALSTQDIQDALANTRRQYQQRVAELPRVESRLREGIYGKDKILPALRRTRDDAISELWQHDQRVAGTYANPESEMFIRDPYAREQLRGAQHEQTFGRVAGMTRLEEAREDILGDALERGIKLFEIGTEAKRQEHEMLLDELSAAVKLQEAQRKAAESAQKKQQENLLGTLFTSLQGARQSYQEREGRKIATVDRLPRDSSGMIDWDRLGIQTSGPVRYEQRPDGKYDIFAGAQAFETAPPPQGDINDFMKMLTAATIAASPDQRLGATEISDLLSIPQEEFEIPQWMVETGLYQEQPGFERLSPEMQSAYGRASQYLTKARDPYGVTGLESILQTQPTATPQLTESPGEPNFIQQLLGSVGLGGDDAYYQEQLGKAARGIQQQIITEEDAINRLKGAFPSKDVESDLRELLG